MRSLATLALAHHEELFKKTLLGFILEQDPVLEMLDWIPGQMMQIQTEAKVGAMERKHSRDGRSYCSGKQIRRMSMQLGAICLYMPMVRKCGYRPFS